MSDFECNDPTTVRNGTCDHDVYSRYDVLKEAEEMQGDLVDQRNAQHHDEAYVQWERLCDLREKVADQIIATRAKIRTLRHIEIWTEITALCAEMSSDVSELLEAFKAALLEYHAPPAIPA